MRKSSIIVAIIILLITIGWIASGQFENTKYRPESSEQNTKLDEKKDNQSIYVRTELSKSEKINKTIKIQGQTTANKTIKIKSETSGKIINLNKKVGEKINKGELIFKISEKDLLLNLEKMKSKFDEATIEFNAENKLFQAGLSSESKLAKAKSNLTDAKSNYDFIKNEINKTNITAPYNGILTSDHLEVGEFVQVGTTLSTFVELDPMLVVGYVSEKELKNITLNSISKVTTSLNENLKGTISYISPKAEEDTRTFRIEITLTNEDYKIKDGLTASIEIQGDEIYAHKISPSILSLRDDGSIGIKVINENKIVDFYNIEVVSDTNDGMWITGIPDSSNIIVVGQEYAPIGDAVNFEKIN